MLSFCWGGFSITTLVNSSTLSYIPVFHTCSISNSPATGSVLHFYLLLFYSNVFSIVQTSSTAGFPDCLSFADFRRQFEVLRITPFESGDVDGGDSVFDEREVNTTFIVLDRVGDDSCKFAF